MVQYFIETLDVCEDLPQWQNAPTGVEDHASPSLSSTSPGLTTYIEEKYLQTSCATTGT